MAVSYISEVIKGNSFIQPFDLNLMAKVNGYLQNQFYTNAAKVENQYSQLQNTDIANKEQNAYLKDKVNNLITQVDGMGALNFADVNVSNALLTYGSEIYNDKYVMEGISSTKRLRQYLSNLETMKTDPKLSKYYSDSFARYDEEEYIKKYVNGGLDATYTGPTAPDPYDPEIGKKIQAEISKLKASYIEKINPDTGLPYYVSVDGKEVLTEDRIVSSVMLNLDGKMKNQFMKDSWYNYIYTTGGGFTKDRAVEQFTKQESVRVKNLTDYISELETSLTDPAVLANNESRDQIQKTLNSAKKQLEDEQIIVNKNVATFAEDYDRDMKTAAYQLYTRNFIADVVNANSYTRSTVKLHNNLDYLAMLKERLAAIKNGKSMGRNSDGSVQYISPSSDFSDDEAVSGLKVNNITIKTETENLQKERNIDIITTIERNAQANGVSGIMSSNNELKFTMNPDDPALRTTNSMLYDIAKLTGTPLFEKEDLAKVISWYEGREVLSEEYKKKLRAQGVTEEEIERRGKSMKPPVTLNENQYKYFKKLYSLWDSAADTPELIKDLKGTDELGAAIERYDMTQNVINKNNLLLEKAKNEVINQYTSKLTPEEAELYRKYIENPENYERLVRIPGNIDNPDEYRVEYFDSRIPKILNRVGVSNSTVTKKINDKLSTLSNREQYFSVTLPEQAGTLPEQTKRWEDFVLNMDNSIAAKDLRVIGIVGGANGKFYIKYTDASKTDVPKATEIDRANFTTMGLTPLPYPKLEYVVRTTNELSVPLKFWVNNNGIKRPVKIQIRGNLNEPGRNNFRATAYIVANNREYQITPTNPVYSESASMAYEYAKTFLTTKAAQGYTFEQILNSL